MDAPARIVGWTAALALSALAAGAQAQVATPLSAEDQARRRELIARAQQVSAGGDHAEALTLAERAGQMRMSPSLRRFIADEQTATGRLVRGLASAELCVREEEQDPAAVGRDVDLPACRALVTDLQARIGHLVVRMPTPEPAGLRVTVGGEALNRALWGVAFAVDPGRVTVETTAPGVATFHRDVDVAAGATVVVPVTLEASVSAAASAGGAAPVQGSPPANGATQRTLAWVALGGAGAALVVGAVANAIREDQAAAFNVRNTGHMCTAAEVRIGETATCRDEAAGISAAQTWAVVGYVAAGAFAATGVVLLVTAPRAASGEAAHAGIGCGLGPGDVGVACGGAF